MLPRIFPLLSDSTRWTSSDATKTFLEPLYSNHQMSLLVIQSEKLEASLLLQAAVSFNTEGFRVSYIATEPMTRMPKLVHGMPSPDPVLMKHVKMLYLRKCDELVGFLSEVHQSATAPDVVIVQHLDHYAEQTRHDDPQHAMARICALLCDTAAFIHSKSGIAPSIVASMRDASAIYRTVAQRFFKDVWTIKLREESENHSDGASGDEYEMVRLNTTGNHNDQTAPSVVFGITEQCLVLHKLIDRHRDYCTK